MNTPGATLGRRERHLGTTICISGIGEREKKTTIQEALGDFGHIVRIEIPDGRRVAFVEYEEKRDALEAVRVMDRKKIGGSIVTVRLADDRMPNSVGKGKGKGGGGDRYEERSSRPEEDFRSGGRRGGRSRSRSGFGTRTSTFALACSLCQLPQKALGQGAKCQKLVRMRLRQQQRVALALALGLPVRELGGAFTAPSRPPSLGRGLGGAAGSLAGLHLHLERGQEVLRCATPPVAPGVKTWLLRVKYTDHYVWKNEDMFVGLVADAGEWEINTNTLREAFNTAAATGSADILTAPLYVVKDYLKELRSYGIVAEALELDDVKAPSEEDAAYRRRDWKELSPELKDSAGLSRQQAEADAQGGKMRVVILNSDHPTFDGTKAAEMKFRAYIEIASDAAKRFAPEENYLNSCYAKIRGSAGQATVLESLAPDAAQRALRQLELAGFKVKVEAEADS